MNDSKLSPGFGEVTLIVNGVKVSYTYQIVEDRMYLDLGSKGPFALFGDAIISELAKFVDSMKQHNGLKVILAGRLPAVCQLRPDLEKFYTGLPDDYRIDSMYGIPVRQQFARLPMVSKTGDKIVFDAVSLAETGTRKAASNLGWQKDEKGSLIVAPAKGRETDKSDLYLITITFNGMEAANKVAALDASYWKTRLPDLYARMKAAGLLAGVE